MEKQGGKESEPLGDTRNESPSSLPLSLSLSPSISPAPEDKEVKGDALGEGKAEGEGEGGEGSPEEEDPDQWIEDPHSREDTLGNFFMQLKLLQWKRYVELYAAPGEPLKVICSALMFFVLLILLYENYNWTSSLGGLLEMFIVPFAFWAYVQRMVVQISTERSTGLVESMKQMGLSETGYFLSYFWTDGVIFGFILSLLCSIMTVGGLFNDGNFGAIFLMFYLFCLSAVSFSLCLSTMFSSPTIAGQGTLAVCLGCYIIPVVLTVATSGSDISQGDLSSSSAVLLMSLVPLMGLQLGCLSFGDSWVWGSDYPTLGSIYGMFIADIFLYLLLAWYFSQVIPSPIGSTKSPFFIFEYNYWFGGNRESSSAQVAQDVQVPLGSPSKVCPTDDAQEAADEAMLGKPTIRVRNLKKSFGNSTVVNNLSFDMYENQIFVLLGHNGAGKTTSINMLTGLMEPDANVPGALIEIYGNDARKDMDLIRKFMGVCPQHDVLLDKLTVREHLLYFAQLKGSRYDDAVEESTALIRTFRLTGREDHWPHELSGGQRRKLSFAISACGGSKFIVLDEPTAGMDTMARRELWDTLNNLRVGRTILLTTHYMDEADVLGDRIGIMSLGRMVCLGSSNYLKMKYGQGYTLIVPNADHSDSKVDRKELTNFVTSNISGASEIADDGSNTLIQYNLPYDQVEKFGSFFATLDKGILSKEVNPSGYGIAVTSLEDVFLRVGGDETVVPDSELIEENKKDNGIGSAHHYEVSLLSQFVGIFSRKLIYASNDTSTLALLGFPVAVIIVAAVLYKDEIISKNPIVNNLATCGMYVGAYLGMPGLFAEFLAKERKIRLRNVLTVMGCDFTVYWIGTFLADYCLMLVPTIVLYISWAAGDMTSFTDSQNGIVYLVVLLFNAQMLAFSYFFSMIFDEPSYSIMIMPLVILGLLVTPSVIVLLVTQIANLADPNGIPEDVSQGVLLWGIMICSPHGALFAAMLDITNDLGSFLKSYPRLWANMMFMFLETIGYLGICYYFDIQTVTHLENKPDPTFDASCLDNLHPDVLAERRRTEGVEALLEPLCVRRLRKVFPGKKGGEPVVATQDVAFTVNKGKIFGLLGANGAGKSTTLSMLTRALSPTSGDATIDGSSILSDFSKAATKLGVVTQSNSLWDKLSVEDHLYLFSKLRGVPTADVEKVVSATIDQLELRPHRKKLAMRLSGGMKRKLCVAIALIGDPNVVLMDEPSAGLDPVSRRNLWSVILRTMAHRSVVLTTHSMEETEALCTTISIMVEGQIAALGSKQKLKNEFGSGFEVVLKGNDRLTADPTAFVKERVAFQSKCTQFMVGSWPSSTLIAKNGGLLTFRVSKEDMKIGSAFDALHKNTMELDLEYYTISQPTLEQVFIRVVKENTTKAVRDEGDDDMLINVAGKVRRSALASEEYYKRTNKCGCLTYQVKIALAVTLLMLFVLFFLGGIDVSRPLQWVIWLSFDLSFLCCCGMGFTLVCPCCKHVKEED